MASGSKQGNDGREGLDPKRRRCLLEDPDVQALLREEGQKRDALPPLLQETFYVNDPIHGLICLPGVVKLFVDSMEFQRMRFIKQLGICEWVFPGATHNRFFHSIGTAYLSWEMIRGLQSRQPELQISNRDLACVTLAGLCHDLGHPCFSHMFEVFMHQLGHERWSHEQASVVLVKELLRRFWPRLSSELGLGSDAEGDDQQLIQELIDPPKAEMEKLKEGKRLKEEWASVLKGRTVDKAWIYEIVSNWRTGIDVDKFDYFRRDALFLGIGRQHDHNRYMKSVKVIVDEDGLTTISPPEKDKDHIRENILELRKTLHRFAYQHKTVKKLEQHMIDILMLFNKHATVTGTNNRRMTIAEAALEVDLVAYPKLTDMLVETRLLEAEEEGLKAACQLYQKTFIQRKLMRNVLIWWLPPAEEVAQRLPTTQQFLREMWELYDQSGPSRPSRDFARDEVRCVDAKLHYGMKQVDPIKKIVFHDKQGQPRLFEDHDANPLRQKFFVLWSPPDELEQSDVPQRLSMAAMGVASKYTTEPETTPVSPLRRKSRSGDLEASPPPSTPKVRLRQKRQLQVESSYPVSTEIFERKLD